MDLLAIIGLGLVAAAICIVLGQHRPEFAMMVSLAAGIFILYQICINALPVLEEIEGIFTVTAMPEQYVSILFRSLGICFITQIACDTCKDAGETAISAKVELAGKISVLVISLPLFQQVLQIVGTLLG